MNSDNKKWQTWMAFFQLVIAVGTVAVAIKVWSG